MCIVSCILQKTMQLLPELLHYLEQDSSPLLRSSLPFFHSFNSSLLLLWFFISGLLVWIFLFVCLGGFLGFFFVFFPIWASHSFCVGFGLLFFFFLMGPFMVTGAKLQQRTAVLLQASPSLLNLLIATARPLHPLAIRTVSLPHHAPRSPLPERVIMHLADRKSNLCLAKMGPINELTGRLAVSRKMG